MIDITVEPPLTFTRAARLVPSGKGDGPCHVNTIYRWAQHGVNGVKLEAVRLGGRWVTTAAAIQRFVEASTAAYRPESAKGPTPVELAREEAMADRLLTAAGF